MLIECPECGREVSSKAAACPECAYPMGSVRSRQLAHEGGGTRGGGGLEVAKQLLGRTIFGGILLASGVAWEAPPVILSAMFVWATCAPIWIKARRADKLGAGGDASRVEKQLEGRMADLEERHVQQIAELEDQQARHIGELEERLDFTERLLTKHRGSDGLIDTGRPIR
jgi:hypothetical protein